MKRTPAPPADMPRSQPILRRSLLQASLALPFAGLAACRNRGPAATALPAGTPWTDIVAAGRREGRVLMYGGVINAGEVAEIARAFHMETGIRFDLLPISGAAALTRIEQEAAIGLAPDIFEATGGWLGRLSEKEMLVPLASQMLPVWSEPATRWNVDPGYKSPDRQFVLSRLRVRQGHLGVNTRLLPERHFPRSWRDLATNPALKRASVLVDPSRSVSASVEFIFQHYIGKCMSTRDLWGIFVAQDPMFVSVARANVMSLAQGERSLTFPPVDETVMDMVEAGAPLRNIYFEDAPVFAETAEMGILKAASNPNAAMVFINWYLGRAGQVLMARLLHQTSLRTDVASGVPAALRGDVVGGGRRGPILVDSPRQNKLIRDFLRTRMMRLLVDRQPPEAFDARWTAFITDWERDNGGPQDAPMHTNLV